MRLSMAMSGQSNGNERSPSRTTRAAPSPPTARPRSNSVSRQIPIPVSIQVFNILADDLQPVKGRLEYSTKLLKPIRVQIIVVNKDQETQVLHEFPPESTTTAPVWAHLSEVLEWESLDRAVYERVQMRFGTAERFFLHIPLHPSQLIPTATLPADRPVNTAVVQFSDETKRVTPVVWQQLPRSATTTAAADNLLLFEEDAFTALESVTRPNLLDAAAAEEEEDGLSLSMETTETQMSSADAMAEQQLQQDVGHLPSVQHARLDALREECERWRARAANQETALAEARVAWEADQALLRDSLQHLSQQQAQLLQIQQATQDEERECGRLELQLEAQRIRLVKELRRIYPITTDGKTWSIRGLVLPSDLFSLPEDDLSAALGMTCHAVSLTSRYLGVPLRYRLYCNSSRSAVQDDRGTVFPLFQARPVEREQVEWGFALLERNIDCIGHAREIEPSQAPSKHLLEKLSEIYTVVIEGRK